MNAPRRFPNTADSVTEARRYALQMLPGIERPVADAVAVMVSELAANAVRHTTSSHFVVSVEQTPDHIRVEVSDSGPGDPVVRAPEPAEPSGRGLQIVRTLAADWGVLPSRRGPGKTVWFTVAIGPSSGEQAHAVGEPAGTRERVEAGAADAPPSARTGEASPGSGAPRARAGPVSGSRR